MSLTSHLRQGKKTPVGNFLRSEFPNTTQFLVEARKCVRQAETIRPTIAVPWTTIGTALDYRLRYYFDAAPSESLVAYKAALMLSETDRRVPFDDRFSYVVQPEKIDFFDLETAENVGRFLIRSNAAVCFTDRHKGLDYFIINEAAPKILQNTARCEPSQHMGLTSAYESIFFGLDSLLSSAKPANKRLSESDEDDLNRYCVVLAAIEEYYRSGRHPSAVLSITGDASPHKFLESVEPHWLEDLKALSRLFYEKCSHLLELPVTLNPTFTGSRDVGNADADLIVDGSILEIKSTVQGHIKADFIWQLLGYVLLDYGYEHNITSVGFYMARQGLLFQRGLMDALSTLSGRESPDLGDLRSRFREVANSSNVSQRPMHRS